MLQGHGKSFFSVKRNRRLLSRGGRAGVNLLKESMDPVSVGLLVMGISTTSVTEANRLEAAQPVLDVAHLISVEKPGDKKEALPFQGRHRLLVRA